MKSLKWALAATVALAVTSTAPNAQAAAGNTPGYYYIAFTYTGGFPNAYNYMSVGAFATQTACQQARSADYGNGDSWLPYDGTGIQCTYVYGNEVGAMQDTLVHWNTVAGGGNGTTPGYLDAEKLEAIAELRDIYQAERYEAELERVLQPRQVANPR